MTVYSAEQRQTYFWSNVDQSGGRNTCWNWLRSTARGYGHLEVGGKCWRANRFAWYLAVGPIPLGLCVLHTCDNPRCCNPLHLWLGTQRDNVHDAISKERQVSVDHYQRKKTHCKHGHPLSGENLYRDHRGWRVCRTCKGLRNNQRRGQAP